LKIKYNKKQTKLLMEIEMLHKQSILNIDLIEEKKKNYLRVTQKIFRR